MREGFVAQEGVEPASNDDLDLAFAGRVAAKRHGVDQDYGYRSRAGGAEMTNVQTDGQKEVVREPKFEGILKAIGGPQFLAAQFFTILATILGVYLAGYVGFQRTLEYDRFVKAQQQSDLLTA